MRAKESYSFDERMRQSGAKHGIYPDLDRGTNMAKVHKYVTGEFEINFPSLSQPDNYGKFTMNMKFPQDGAAYQEITSLIKEVDQTSGSGMLPIKKFNDEIEIKGKSNKAIPCFNGVLEAIQGTDIVSGDICRANINIVSWEFQGNQGVSVWVNSVQKTKDGDRAFASADGSEFARDAGSSAGPNGKPPASDTSDETDKYRKAFGFD